MSEENKALVRRWLMESDKGNPDIVDELIATDYIDHNPPLPGTAPGKEGVKQTNALLRAAFPDAMHIIEDQIAEGDKVMTRMIARGTFTGECLGIPPNGQLVTMEGIPSRSRRAINESFRVAGMASSGSGPVRAS